MDSPIIFCHLIKKQHPTCFNRYRVYFLNPHAWKKMLHSKLLVQSTINTCFASRSRTRCLGLMVDYIYCYTALFLFYNDHEPDPVPHHIYVVLYTTTYITNWATAAAARIHDTCADVACRRVPTILCMLLLSCYCCLICSSLPCPHFSLNTISMRQKVIHTHTVCLAHIIARTKR